MSSARDVHIDRIRGKDAVTTQDFVATEEPLEIRVEGKSVAVVMRTPGHDEELAAGFLLSEGMVQGPEDFFELSTCPASGGNVVDVLLKNPDQAKLESLTRHVFSSSSCGICGKATIDSVFQTFPKLPEATFRVDARVIKSMPGRLREEQETFEKTGGLHASALFSREGAMQILREDVGRHNALDKVLGRTLLDGHLPLHERILLVSGRVSFELVQKALAGGITVLAAISAPSSLAVEFAEEADLMLIGFLRGDGMNVYSGSERLGIR